LHDDPAADVFGSTPGVERKNAWESVPRLQGGLLFDDRIAYGEGNMTVFCSLRSSLLCLSEEAADTQRGFDVFRAVGCDLPGSVKRRSTVTVG